MKSGFLVMDNTIYPINFKNYPQLSIEEITTEKRENQFVEYKWLPFDFQFSSNIQPQNMSSENKFEKISIVDYGRENIFELKNCTIDLDKNVIIFENSSLIEYSE